MGLVLCRTDSGSHALADSKACVSTESVDRPRCQRDELCVAHGRMAALPKPQVGNVALQAGEAPVQAQEARRRNHARSSWPFIPMTQERLPLDSQSQLRPHPGITGGALTHADAWVWPLEMLTLLV